MPKRKSVSVEILRKPSPADMKALLDRMVRERVDEVMAARDADQLAPTHQPRESANEMRRHQTMFDRRKWRLYFQKWGCARCGRKKNVSYASNGFCVACNGLLVQRLVQIRREFDRAHPDRQIAEDIDHLTRRVRAAEALLGE